MLHFPIAKKFRDTNIVLFLISFMIIILVTIVVLRGVTGSISAEYAQLYSTNTASVMNTYLNREIPLVSKAAYSKAIVDWFRDEDDDEKKAAAFEEMTETIKVLYSNNFYMAIHGSLNEYNYVEGMSPQEFNPHSSLTEGYYDDVWYFEAMEADDPYKLNVDIDKALKRKLVWINHKVTYEGEPVGIICSGLEFAGTVEALLSEYDNSKVRGVVIDADGIVQMDSISLGGNSFLRYEEFYDVTKEFTDPDFIKSLREHLGGINGFFGEDDRTIVVNTATGKYDYATIAPILDTDWSVITFYNSSSLFNISKLIPVFGTMLVMLICYAALTTNASYRLLFKPIEMLVGSLKTAAVSGTPIYGIDRHDEIGQLASTISDMKHRLDSYNTDLEIEVAERSADLKLAYDQAREQNQLILSNVGYASKIQKSSLPTTEAMARFFPDHSVLWKPRDIVGGDVYWFKRFSEGAMLCVCDCTGHGTSGALLTMLALSSLEAIVDETNCKDTANTIWSLEQRFVTVLNSGGTSNDGVSDGCDLAVLFIANDGSVTVSSAHMHVFICDGDEVSQVRGQNIYVGENRLAGKDEITATAIPHKPGRKFYVASDGLFDQMGGNPTRPFGYGAYKEIILEHHDEPLSVISGKIWEAFEAYRGSQTTRDDVELIAFTPPAG